MIIQIIIIAAVAFTFIWFLSHHRTYQVHALSKVIVTLFALLAVVVAVAPDSANTIAHWVGVGRGADLLLYVLSLTYLYTLLYQYIRNKEENKRFVKLARKIAIIEATSKKN